VKRLLKQKKTENIDKLEKEFTRCSIGILTDYRGLKTSDMDGLRRKLQESGGDYKVVKNTLAVKAAEKINRKDITGGFSGPVAVAFGYGEANDTAKVFTDYVRASKMSITVKGGFITDGLLSAADVTTLATLPSKPVLIARVIGGIKSPLYGLASALVSPIRGLQWVLQSRIKKLEGTN
jgi:large subunit ribosomal protein L10